jgi:hypothetical protein
MHMHPVAQERRRTPRRAVSWRVEVRIGSWFSIHVQPRDISRGGVCVELPGGAAPGELYQVVFTPQTDRELALPARVRWVGRRDSMGFVRVGLRFEADSRAIERLDALLREV